MKTNFNLRSLLAGNVAEILRQAVDLLNDIDNEFYTRSNGAFADGGSIGGHFRHCLEFVNGFLAGIGTGRVDYNKRERNHKIETNCEYAISEFLRTIQVLETVKFSEIADMLLVKPEDIADDDDGEEYWSASSPERELDFLQSHTIHHYALIGFKLRSFGFHLPAELGVAPSTLRYWNEQKSVAATTE